MTDLAAFDFYSCFPIAVSNVAQDEFGLSAEEPRRLTVTGGLPFFGGPGNNYAMHALAEMVEKVRGAAGRPGFIGANGGFLSKYSAGVYSITPKTWNHCDSNSLQAELDTVSSLELVPAYEGKGVVETYTVHHKEGQPRYAVVVGRSAEGRRFIARSAKGDARTTIEAHQKDALRRAIRIKVGEDQTNNFTFT